MGEEAYDLEGGDGDEEMAFSDKTVRFFFLFTNINHDRSGGGSSRRFTPSSQSRLVSSVKKRAP